MKRAVENLEALSSSLEKRYLARTNEMKIEKEMKEMRLNIKTESDNINKAEMKEQKIPNGSIGPSKISNGINEGKYTLVLYYTKQGLSVNFLFQIVNEGIMLIFQIL